jgi:hypothetical protein
MFPEIGIEPHTEPGSLLLGEKEVAGPSPAGAA